MIEIISNKDFRDKFHPEKGSYRAGQKEKGGKRKILQGAPVVLQELESQIKDKNVLKIRICNPVILH